MNDIKIQQVTIQPGAKITKGITMASGPGFIVPVTFHLVNGQTIESTISRRKKKDVLPAVANAQRFAQDGSMSASFDEAGKFWGTVQKFTIGGALVPQAPRPLPAILPTKTIGDADAEQSASPMLICPPEARMA